MDADYKRLYRSRTEVQIAGICGGLGLYFSLDPVLIRLIAVAITLMTGLLPGILAYLAAWLIMPREPAPRAAEGVPQAHEGSA